VRVVDETGSTNVDLLAAAERGDAVDRTVLRTDHQTAGRGRLDRRWDAPPGTNLLASILFTEPGADPMTLVQRIGVAAVEAIEAAAGSPLDDRLGLKWPNDLLLDGAKLAGVLAQRSTTTGAVVVGLGLNVGWAPTGAASLASNLHLDTTPHRLLELLLDCFDRSVDVSEAYRRRLLTLGEVVRVELPAGNELVGKAIDIDHRGRLVVQSGDMRHVLDVGDVIHLRT
jgi:BirA family biotin operon repressor/biotin-[acetyl-CoA-carboxylase] ligase